MDGGTAYNVLPSCCLTCGQPGMRGRLTDLKSAGAADCHKKQHKIPNLICSHYGLAKRWSVQRSYVIDMCRRPAAYMHRKANPARQTSLPIAARPARLAEKQLADSSRLQESPARTTGWRRRSSVGCTQKHTAAPHQLTPMMHSMPRWLRRSAVAHSSQLQHPFSPHQ